MQSYVIFGYFSLFSYAVAVKTAVQARPAQHTILLLTCFVAASTLLLFSFGQGEIFATPELDTKACERIEVAKGDAFWMKYCHFEQFEDIFVWKGLANKYGFDPKAAGEAIKDFVFFIDHLVNTR